MEERGQRYRRERKEVGEWGEEVRVQGGRERGPEKGRSEKEGEEDRRAREVLGKGEKGEGGQRGGEESEGGQE